MNTKVIKFVFAASAFYDAILAVIFLFFARPIFNYFGVELPNHMGYLHFPALLLVLFAWMYWRIASDPARYRNLMPYGIGLKASYCIVVLYHWATGGVPSMWIPLAWIDFIFLILFVQAWRKAEAGARPAQHARG